MRDRGRRRERTRAEVDASIDERVEEANLGCEADAAVRFCPNHLLLVLAADRQPSRLLSAHFETEKRPEIDKDEVARVRRRVWDPVRPEPRRDVSVRAREGEAVLREVVGEVGRGEERGPENVGGRAHQHRHRARCQRRHQRAVVLAHERSGAETVCAKVLGHAVQHDDARWVAAGFAEDVDGEERGEGEALGVAVKDAVGVDLVRYEVDTPLLCELCVRDEDLARVAEACRVLAYSAKAVCD